MIQDINSREFGELLESLANDIVSGAIHYQLYKDIRDSIPEFERELNQTPGFWSLTLYAYLDAARSRIFRAYDQHPHGLSLKKLLEIVNANPTLFANRDEPLDLEGVKRDLLLVTPVDPLVKTLVAIRGNIHAHKRAANVIRKIDISDRFPLSEAEFDQLVERAVTLLNRYATLFRRISWSTEMIGRDDWKFVLTCVRDALERDEAEFQEAMRRDSGLEKC